MNYQPVGILHLEDQEEYEYIQSMKSNTSEYKAWSSMKSRCSNSKRRDYNRYGGRGIIVCENWAHSFSNFFRDMGKKPSSKHSLDRIDVNGNYCKENCRWATIREQNNNRRDNMVYKNETAAQASKRLGGGTSLVNGRIIAKGWSYEKAFTTPLRNSLKYKGIDAIEASKNLGGNEFLVYRRLRSGWNIKDAFTSPIKRLKRKNI